MLKTQDKKGRDSDTGRGYSRFKTPIFVVIGNMCVLLAIYIQGGPKKVSHYQFFKKIVLKIANEIRFLRKVKV